MRRMGCTRTRSAWHPCYRKIQRQQRQCFYGVLLKHGVGGGEGEEGRLLRLARSLHSQQHHLLSQARPNSEQRCRCSHTWQVYRSHARVRVERRKLLFGARVYVNEYESRAQPLQSGCSVRVTRCLCAPVPANGLGLVFTNASTALVKASDIEQCCRMFLGGGKLVQPQPFSVVLNNAKAIGVHEAQVVLRPIKVLRCSQPIQRKRLGVILLKSS